MLKQNLLRSAILTVAVLCLFLLAACGGDPAKENSEQTSSQTDVEPESDISDPDSALPEADTSATSPETPDNAVAKISGGADEVGIYSVAVQLTEQAADKGVVEMVYYGSKGSPQENSVVNTFRIEYSKEPAGTFNIKTFYDGEVYQNFQHKNAVNVVNTFGATLRAGNVTVSYTPDGGDTQEIFKADAEYFRTSAN